MIKKVIRMLFRYYRFKKKKVIIKFNSYVDKNTTIGSYSYVGYGCMITNVSIGRYCSIANSVFIGMGEHDLKNVSTSIHLAQKSIESLTQDSVIIEDDVWIGVNVVILRGVVIGRGAVIGAGAVVTKDVPPYTIVVGVPAIILRKRFDNDIIKLIEASKWWEKDLAEAKKITRVIYEKINE